MAFFRTSNKRPWQHLLTLIGAMLTSCLVWADDWSLQKVDEQRDIRVYQRAHANSAFDDVYAVTELAGRPSRIEAILTDAVAMPEWIARVSQAKVISRQHHAAILYLRYTLPYPFRARDAVLLSKREQTATGMIIEAEAISDKYPVQPGVVRMLGAKSRWQVTALPGNRVKVELWGSGEPGGLIPSVLYNYNLADDAVQTLRQLRRMALREKYQRAEVRAEAAQAH
ncbi:START domain-containing protein [Paraperlucidibaca baekdonensis]|uniref:START domain-containing protein n=1 Tax=Paraperlucidibaca baekdonensis TaxID=748120 RepID=A0A3E0H8U0_9GAMM|nr:START domain-containing protein [Paraperlucidibaca baekdonensis]REH40126.1 START domain-containing protein [Paraperlucidibaca baekdonensis]